MAKSIDQQAKNEVKDLLNEYVVTPINVDIIRKLGKIGEQLEKISESTETIKIGVNDEMCKLSEKIDNANSAISDNLSEEIDKLDSIEELVNDTNSDLRSLIEEYNSVLTDKISAFEANQSDLISKNYAAIESCENAIAERSINLTEQVELNRQELKKKYDSLEKMLDDLQTAIKNILIANNTSIEQLSKNNHSSVISELQSLTSVLETEKKIFVETLNEHYGELLKNEAENKTVFEGQISELNKSLTKSFGTIQESVNVKYKYLFKLTLSFGITNFMAIVVMIILFFVK